MDHAIHPIAPSLTDAIPEPETIRTRIADLTRETALLRQLLRVSERKERQRRIREEVACAS